MPTSRHWRCSTVCSRFTARRLGLRAQGKLEPLAVLHANAVRPDLPAVGVEQRLCLRRIVRVVRDVRGVRPRVVRLLVGIGRDARAVLHLVDDLAAVGGVRERSAHVKIAETIGCLQIEVDVRPRKRVDAHRYEPVARIGRQRRILAATSARCRAPSKSSSCVCSCVTAVFSSGRIL